MPYFGYARQDRRPRSARVPISAKVVADMLTTVGVDRVMTMDLHADQIQGFFNIPVDNIYATPILLGDVWKQNYDNLLVVSPDVGGVVRARAIAKRLDSDLAIIDKRRPKANVAEVMNIIGDVEGRTCVIMDDIVDTANTLCKAATALKEHGAQQGRRVLHASGALGRRGVADRRAPTWTRSSSPTRSRCPPKAQRLPAHPPAVLRAAARRDDDADLQRGVGARRCSPSDFHWSNPMPDTASPPISQASRVLITGASTGIGAAAARAFARRRLPRRDPLQREPESRRGSRRRRPLRRRRSAPRAAATCERLRDGARAWSRTARAHWAASTS